MNNNLLRVIRPDVVSSENPRSDVNSPLLMTKADLATALATSTKTIDRLDQRGKLPRPIRLGRQNRWRRAEIEQWVEAGMPARREWERFFNE